MEQEEFMLPDELHNEVENVHGILDWFGLVIPNDCDEIFNFYQKEASFNFIVVENEIPLRQSIEIKYGFRKLELEINCCYDSVHGNEFSYCNKWIVEHEKNSSKIIVTNIFNCIGAKLVDVNDNDNEGTLRLSLNEYEVPNDFNLMELSQLFIGDPIEQNEVSSGNQYTYSYS